MKNKQETKQAAALEVPVGELPSVRPVVNNLRDMMPTSREVYDYDSMWGVSGYYNDNDGNDIRDRD